MGRVMGMRKVYLGVTVFLQVLPQHVVLAARLCVVYAGE